jgi:trehalose 6-phosphate synthase/phosphatase
MLWHYGNADLQFASWQAKELQNHLEIALGSTYPIHIHPKKKALEICPKNVNKGVAIAKILGHHDWPAYDSGDQGVQDLILSIGDGRSDEYMFEYLSLKEAATDVNPSTSKRRIITCKVGRQSTHAKWYISGSPEVS